MFKPFIIGIEGKTLNANEIDFIKKHQPYGFILFSRNIEDKKQVKSLTDSFRDLTHENIPILIDQEGGRVQRLRPPIWRNHAAFGRFEEIYKKNQQEAIQNLQNTTFEIADELHEIGVNVNCSPMIDVKDKNAHDIIGDRAFSSDENIVAELGKVIIDSFKQKNIMPIIKHIPGHGRATQDSHFDLPVVNATKEDLKKDFYPFKALNVSPFAMTAHIVYKSLDDKPATLSKKIIHDIIRNEIGFKNILMTDDISMKALSGNLGDLSIQSLQAGCDLILHCNGKMQEMLEIANKLDFAHDNFIIANENILKPYNKAA